MEASRDYDSQCKNCYSELESPYIVCAVCIVNICATCFSQGAEFDQHENNHDYSVFNHHFVLFENCQWTAKEELLLLDSLLRNQNFAVAKQVLPQYSEKEIKEHYEYYYVQKNGTDLIPSFSSTVEWKSNAQCLPYTMSLNNTDDPPRYTQGSIGYEGVAGYNAFRGDFEVEYDHLAEELLNDMSYQADPQDSDYEQITDLQCAIVSSYNRRLRKRHDRRLAIRNHGLICPRKVYAWLYRYETTLTNKVYKHLIRFAPFFTGEEFEKFMEGLHLAGELKAKIARYSEYRQKGIKTKRGIQLYLRLKQQRQAAWNEVEQFRNLMPYNLKSLKRVTPTETPGPVKKRGFNPLEVDGLPGYDQLTTKEQELCRNVRLVPISYLEFRDLLVNENRKCGYLRLQTARKLLKIDVNKTRRLYDFLIQEGYINVEPL